MRFLYLAYLIFLVLVLTRCNYAMSEDDDDRSWGGRSSGSGWSSGGGHK